MNDYEIAVIRGQQNMSQEQRLAACRGQQNGWRPGIENEARWSRTAALVQLDADLMAAARIRVDWIFWGWVIGLFSLATIRLFLVL